MPDAELRVQTDDGVSLAGQRAGTGPAIVLLHGLTATRRYIVMGSRVLERAGLLVLAYDARGHGRSSAAPDARAYGYERLARDLEQVLDARGSNGRRSRAPRWARTPPCASRSSIPRASRRLG